MVTPERLTAQTGIADALGRGKGVVEAFRALGLKCPGCVAAEVETLRHAALYHGKNLEEVLEGLNAALGDERACG